MHLIVFKMKNILIYQQNKNKIENWKKKISIPILFILIILFPHYSIVLYFQDHTRTILVMYVPRYLYIYYLIY